MPCRSRERWRCSDAPSYCFCGRTICATGRETLLRISDFLGIAPFPAMPPKRENARDNLAYPSLPTPVDLDYFCAVLGDDLRQFAALMGLDIAGWTMARRLEPRFGAANAD